ncbi:MAG: hypothetical protein PF450_11715, partial [Bacteroidales bacterium]|nr:hypothetical protein [Bacteroidales bacterium]
MLTNYFKSFDDKLLKKSKKKAVAAKTAGKASKKKTSSKKAAIITTKLDVKQIQNALEHIIPSNLSIDIAKPIDSGGFAPEGADLCIFKKYCEYIINVMGGFLPYE